ncbi:MAG: hypothetical protein E6K80_06630 [Candidatus Eisenbacteria bacterium]|uniref:Uncharacterized protein n=1 Tax=Eiseniibacteriota bacterium TaxID=2212470 RepID=A0A538U5C8_UNCEI|nr:MAG: hypothetical protein E6K80_06630 [Candidatus Eisenbacteria bacterium]
MCASIVDFHGGRMSARREPGRGTVIAASLPRRSIPRVIVRADSELSESVHDVARLASRWCARSWTQARCPS